MTYLHNPYQEDPAPVASLPEGWDRTAIGPSTVSSGEGYAYRNIFTLDGSGESTDATRDAVEFLSLPVAGDIEITARICRVQKNISSGAFAGIMVRSSLDPEATFSSIGITADGTVSFRYRTLEGTPLVSGSESTLSTPVWVKLVRKGNLFSAYSSLDGTTWSQEGNGVEISMAGSTFTGLAATSQNRDFLSAATFEQVRITSN